MKFEDIKSLFNSEMNVVNQFIIESLHSNVNLINNIGEYVVLYGGKRVRPLIVLLFCKIFSCNESKAVSMASAIELIHTATLLHDDVVDLSDKRRGKLTVNNVWGNKEAILVGDFLYTRSFQIMVNVNSLEILKLMSYTTNIMSEGEVTQLVNRGNFDIKEKDCLNIAKCKTAQLFSAAASVGAILVSADEKLKIAANDYGLYLGMAYQLIDDMLDYATDDIRFGKKIGTDITSSTFTLPLVYVMNTDCLKKALIRDILSANLDEDAIFKIRKFVLESNAIDYTFSLACEYISLAKKAILSIPENKYTQLAIFLADFVLNRKY